MCLRSSVRRRAHRIPVGAITWSENTNPEIAWVKRNCRNAKNLPSRASLKPVFRSDILESNDIFRI